jgi:DNA repair ATPase RecN
MTPESIERSIQFILQQQAAFEVTIQKNEERLIQRWEKTQSQIDDNARQIAELAVEARKRNAEASERDAQIRRALDELRDRVDTLRDACRELNEHADFTDWRLNRLENPPE